MRRRNAGPRVPTWPAEFWTAVDEHTPEAIDRAVRLAEAAGFGAITALRMSVIHHRGGRVPWDPTPCPCPQHQGE